MASPKSPAARPGIAFRLGRIVEMFRRQRLFAACLAVVLLGGIAVAAVMMFGGPQQGVTVELGGPMVLQPLPEIVADLKPSARRSHHIKLIAVAQLPAKQVAAFTAKEVEMAVALQARLRELSVEDVAGAEGADRLRAVMIEAINGAVAPAQVRNVLFTQMVVD